MQVSVPHWVWRLCDLANSGCYYQSANSCYLVALEQTPPSTEKPKNSQNVTGSRNKNQALYCEHDNIVRFLHASRQRSMSWAISSNVPGQVQLVHKGHNKVIDGALGTSGRHLFQNHFPKQRRITYVLPKHLGRTWQVNNAAVKHVKDSEVLSFVTKASEHN